VPAQCYQWLDQVPDLVGLGAAAPRDFPFLLDNAARTGCSLLLLAGNDALVQYSNGDVEGPGQGGSFFERLDQWYRSEAETQPIRKSPPVPDFPFNCGWFIYLGYEIAGSIEQRLQLPRNPTSMPDAIACKCPGAIVVFHDWQRPGHERPHPAVAVAEDADTLRRILALLEAGSARPVDAIPALASLQADAPGRFEDGVRTVLDYLGAGDVFQVNISRRWRGRFSELPDPAALYRSLCSRNPAPFAGMLRWRDSILLSSSPERLVELRGKRVQTRPIAGTRPRGSNEAQDLALARELISNPKEQAEHVMMIDLERNDLGRVCRPGSVEVSEFMVIESYAHVHHIVSNVRGVLRDDAGPVQAIQAVFPGGTITGCPKVRCMEIIAEFEQEGRGFYTGSMGYLDRNGNLYLNILIRSMLLEGQQVSFRTGAGIVADSDPAREVKETEAKARGLLLALQTEGSENLNA
jgi:anthranilate synthase component 1